MTDALPSGVPPSGAPPAGEVAGAGPLVFLIAGEPSGDLLGARLMAALRAETGGRVRFAGVGGEAMTAEGLQSRFPIQDLAVMGFIEVLPHLFTILRRMRETVAAVKAARPDVVVTIDSPSFTLEVAGRLKGHGIPLIHYVAPQVWVWKPWRAKQVAGYLDHLLTLLPFEPPYFERHGLPAHFVGHPVVESAPAEALSEGGKGELCLAVLPGSRKAEVGKLLPVFAAVVRALAAKHPNLRVVIPTVETVADVVRAGIADWPLPVEVVRGAEAKAQAFARATAALAASGTVALELAVAGVPAVIAYRFAGFVGLMPISWTGAPYASLVNIIAKRAVQPEFLQRQCRAQRILPAVERLLSEPAARAAQRAAYLEVVAALTPPEGSPSRAAARRVLACIGEGKAASARRSGAERQLS